MKTVKSFFAFVAAACFLAVSAQAGAPLVGIYTAVTRGKRLVVIVGSKKALRMGVKNDETARRYTHLAERLMSGLRKSDP